MCNSGNFGDSNPHDFDWVGTAGTLNYPKYEKKSHFHLHIHFWGFQDGCFSWMTDQIFTRKKWVYITPFPSIWNVHCPRGTMWKTSWESKGTPPMPPPPRDEALIRPGLGSPLIRPYFGGGGCPLSFPWNKTPFFHRCRKRKAVDLEELKSDHGAKADAVGKLLGRQRQKVTSCVWIPVVSNS